MSDLAIRCSALPRIAVCPASLAAPDVVIDPDSENAAVGNAVHAALADYSPTGTLRLDYYADTYQVEVSQVAPLFYIAKRRLDDLLEVVGDVRTEQPIEAYMGDGITLTGHPDLVAQAVDGESTVILDYKTGNGYCDPWDQLRGYAAILDASRDELRTYTLILFWVRENVAETIEIDSAGLYEWWDALPIHDDKPKLYRPGEACKYCPLQYTCAARATMVQSAATCLVALPDGALATPAYLASIKPQADAVKKALAQYDAMLKEAVREAGTLAIDENTELHIVETTREDIVLNDDSVGAIGLAMSDNELWSVLKVQKKAMLDAVAENAPRGQKGKAKVALMDELRELNSVVSSTVERLATRRIDKEN